MQMMLPFRLGNWGAEKVGYFTPYLDGDEI
jgi:hypothetical protein